jgi:hypothetical protein
MFRLKFIQKISKLNFNGKLQSHQQAQPCQNAMRFSGIAKNAEMAEQ